MCRMYELRINDYFSAAHKLRDYQGKCEKLHGHNWKIEAFLTGKKLNKTGMLLDFKDIKAILKKILCKLDHQYLNEILPFDKINPTSENLARFIFEEFKGNLLSSQIQLYKITVWETSSASASYSEL